MIDQLFRENQVSLPLYQQLAKLISYSYFILKETPRAGRPVSPIQTFTQNAVCQRCDARGAPMAAEVTFGSSRTAAGQGIESYRQQLASG